MSHEAMHMAFDRPKVSGQYCRCGQAGSADQKTWSVGGPVAQLAALNNLSPAHAVRLSYSQHARDAMSSLSTPNLNAF